MTSDGKVLSMGQPVRLLDGTTRSIRYGCAGLQRLEDDFGSLGAVMQSLAAGADGKAVTDVVRMLAAGMGERPEVLVDQLDTRQLRHYREAVSAALAEALPASDDVTEASPPGGGGEQASPAATAGSARRRT